MGRSRMAEICWIAGAVFRAITQLGTWQESDTNDPLGLNQQNGQPACIPLSGSKGIQGRVCLSFCPFIPHNFWVVACLQVATIA